MTVSPALLDAYRYQRAIVSAPIRAADALNQARFDVAAGHKRYGAPSPASLTWQPSEPGCAYVDQPEAFGLRHVGNVQSEVYRYSGRQAWNTIGHDGGWHTDPHGDVCKDGHGSCWGVVYQLPGRGGRARFVAGYQFGGTDAGPTLDLDVIHFSDPTEASAYDANPRDLTAAREAARRADDMARRAAEEEREYQTAWQAGTRWAEAGDDIAVTRKHALALLRERRAVKGSEGFPTICATIREAVDRARGKIEGLRSDRDRLANGDFSRLEFWPGDKRLRDAFNEGAGRAVLA